jgi:hypothetical protein
MVKVEARLEDRPLDGLLQFCQSLPQGRAGGLDTRTQR